MVTSNIVPDKKIVKMGDMSNSSVVPQRTLLGEVNEHITCPLCRGYYIDATTIVECLHSFCRSCIIKHLKDKSYCPVCEMMINSAKPNIKLDKALQDIVYKLVPGLFQKEMERRQHFYSSRPGPAASATPEQRGEDTERIIFSPEDVISFSLEYTDVTDTDSISSKSSDSNEPPTLGTTRRYLQCPAVVNISHLKKFLSMKFDIDSTQFAIEILYKRVPLSDYYTLMDIAYIYNWKRNEPMRFFYQIIDYVAIRNRIFDINRKSSHFRENKSSSAPTDDTNVNSPVPHLNDQGSEVSSGTDSPMPEENNMKQTGNDQKDQNKEALESKHSEKSAISSKKNEEDVEKSQFLNSFELTAKSNCVPKTSPVKAGTANESTSKPQVNSPKTDDKIDTLKRKYQTPPNTPELKKLKIELEKTKIPNMLPSSLGSSTVGSSSPASNQNMKAIDASSKGKEPESKSKTSQGCIPMTNVASSSNMSKEVKQQVPTTQQQNLDGSGVKRTVMTAQNLATSKRKPTDILSAVQQSPSSQKTISPLKIQMSKLESQQLMAKTPEAQKQPVKKMPDLKPSMPPPSHQNKGPPVNKVRMDLLANNSDPTIDRSKILNQVKTSLSSQNVASTTGGDPLKSLFDSCKINIPSSLSITLTDQKLDPRNAGDPAITDPKKNIVNKNLVGASNSLTHKIPSPPVHNYIEILKIPENDQKKPNKPETGVDTKSKTQNKSDTPTGPTKPASKSSESSAKGPVPNLKPIADTKLAKQVAANYSGSGPITFQQTFEQQIHTLTTDTKSKGPKTKAQVPKLVPATPKAFSAANKPGTFMGKPNATVENKSSTALDLSSPHSIQSPSGPQQTFDKAFETMQSIANLAKKQNLPPKGLQPSMSQSTSFPSMSNRPMSSGVSPLRIPSTSNINQTKLDKGPSGTPISNARQELNKPNPMKPANSSSPRTCSSPNYQVPSHASASNAQPSPRQTRSPSSSPKLVIAEEKQSTSTPPEQNMNQSNQITSTQFSNVNSHKSESPTAAAGPSKTGLKSLKPITPCGKLTGSRHPITPMLKPHPSGMSAADYLRPQFMHNALMRHQLEMNAAWMKAQRQYDFDLFKNMTNMAHHSQNDFNKDKQ